MCKKIVVRIDSGLGNQLFQYACGYSVARNKGFKLVLDPYFRDDVRTYQLDNFNIDYDCFFVNRRLDEWLEKKRYHLGLEYRKLKAHNYEYVQEQIEFVPDNNAFKGNRSKYLKGFWQSYKYFDEYYEDIRRQFAYIGEMSKQTLDYIELMSGCNSVSMHVRRTDYVRTIDNVSIGIDYYQKALIKMKESVGDFKLFIFSDDKEYVKKMFGEYNYQLVEGISDIEEFICMQSCKHHIIANSTFSWWAAYLSENKGNYVVAPVSGIWTENFYLPQWDKIGVDFE